MKKSIRLASSGTLLLKRTVLRFMRRRIAIGSLSARFIGRRDRLVRLSFVPKDPSASDEIGAIDLVLPRVQAWSLAEWIIEQTVKRAPPAQRR